jgi:hypothetical protein
MFRSARRGICSGTSSSSIRKSLSKDCPQNRPSKIPTQRFDLARSRAARSALTQLGDLDTDVAELDSESENGHAEQLHTHYVREMWCLCVTHTLVDAPDVRLKEEEVVLGTILVNCAQSQWRTDRTYRMNLHVEGLVDDIHGQIVQIEEVPTKEQFRSGLSRAWAMWAWAQHHRDKEFIESSLLALGLIIDYLKRLDRLPQA